ncbi:phage head-tail connector protein [Clostridium tetani]|uniref:phage head-tail connector protein n=1 Tax=Clostridium tetani TaxID=1513 RepID=UPI00100B035C|nr:phage head-tail connector protein [Clostridium tetani]RXM70852.1 DNA-packaging protein [Clostridium tetani]
MENDVLELVKLRLGLKDDKLDDVIKNYIYEMKFKILNYCHIKTIPRDLMYLWATMTMDIVRVDQAYLDEISNTIADNVKSINLGDISVNFGSSNEVTSTSKKSINDIVLNYEKELRSSRKVKKP